MSGIVNTGKTLAVKQIQVSLSSLLADLQCMALGIIESRGGFGRDLPKAELVEYRRIDGEIIVLRSVNDRRAAFGKVLLEIFGLQFVPSEPVSLDDGRLLSPSEWVALVRGDARRLYHALSLLPEIDDLQHPRLKEALRYHGAIVDRWLESWQIELTASALRASPDFAAQDIFSEIQSAILAAIGSSGQPLKTIDDIVKATRIYGPDSRFRSEIATLKRLGYIDKRAGRYSIVKMP